MRVPLMSLPVVLRRLRLAVSLADDGRPWAAVLAARELADLLAKQLNRPAVKAVEKGA